MINQQSPWTALLIVSVLLIAFGLINNTTRTISIWGAVIVAGFIVLHGINSGSYRGNT